MALSGHNMVTAGVTSMAGMALIMTPGAQLSAGSTVSPGSMAADAYYQIAVTAPARATQWAGFSLGCSTPDALGGSTARVYQNGKRFAAARNVDSTGDCSMWIMSGKRGANDFQVRVYKGKRVYESNVVTVRVR